MDFWADYLDGNLGWDTLAVDDFAATFLDLAVNVQGRLSDEQFSANQAALDAVLAETETPDVALADLTLVAVQTRQPADTSMPASDDVALANAGVLGVSEDLALIG